MYTDAGIDIYRLLGAAEIIPWCWEGGWDVHLMAAKEGGYTVCLFLCRVSWSRSAIKYMAVNPTSTGACFVHVILS